MLIQTFHTMFKNLFLSSTLLFLFLTSEAAIITVSNYGGSPAMYTNLTTAVDAAVADDTILIHASATPYTFDNYNGFNKRLTVYGSGFGGLGTKVRGALDGCCGNRVPFNSGAEGSIFRGIEFVSVADIGASQLIFEACRFNPENNGQSAIRTNIAAGCGACGGYPYDAQDIVFQNCYINSHLEGLNNDTNLLFQNSIFSFSSNPAGSAIRLLGSEFLTATNPHVFDHNIFLGYFDLDFSNAVFTNNVFTEFSGYNGISNGSGNFCFGCQFENNMTYCSSCTLSSINGAILTGNLENQPAPFVNSNVNLAEADFNIIDSSLGNGYATDGSDVGVHGGSNAYITETDYGSVLLEMPIITAFSVLNNILQQGTNLNFQGTSTIPAQE
jgi:hypothetical protein